MSKRTPDRDARKLVPRLRFPEYIGGGKWNKQSLGQLLKIGSGKDYKHLSNGDIPVYGTGGYMLSVNEYLYDGESVCIGRKGTIDKPFFLNEKFWTVDTLFYTHSFKDCTPWFIYLIFQIIDWQRYNEASGVPSLSRANIEKITVSIPTLPEQQKIAACLSSLDDLIAAYTDRLDALKEHKQGLLQQLFPREGEMVPRLRFPEFRQHESWTRVAIGQYLKAYSERVDAERVPFPVFSSTRDGLTPQNDYYDNRRLANYGEYGVVPCGYFVYRHMSDDTIFRFNVNTLQTKIAVSKEYPVFSAVGIDKKFLFYILNYSDGFKKFAYAQRKGGTRTRLYFNTLKTLMIEIPTIKEQKKISSCLGKVFKTPPSTCLEREQPGQ